MTAAKAKRIATLDIVRGVAVIGILAMNIVAFAMPPQAYINPLAFGAESAADLAVYAFNFVLIDGKMRGLFSFLFGASMLLVIQLAEKSGESARRVTFRRQLWLLLFGMIHYYLIWFGDILIGYALIGMVAWFFRNKSPKALIVWGSLLVVLELAMMAGSAAYAQSLSAAMAVPNPSPEAVKAWAEFSHDIAIPSAEVLRETMALYLGPWSGIAEYQLTEKAFMPIVFTLLFGPETLAYMLYGMAALKTGFLTGRWDDASYRKAVMAGFAVAIPAYLILVALIFADRFSVEGLFTWSFAATVAFRPALIVAYAALIILLTRRGGALVDRIAAAGRAAFTNYLGTSIIMTGLFYGWGLDQFGQLSRAELWLVVVAMWALMLLWSKPWLDRFQYGPFEWLWRSLARWELQPMAKRGVPAEA